MGQEIEIDLDLVTTNNLRQFEEDFELGVVANTNNGSTVNDETHKGNE